MIKGIDVSQLQGVIDWRAVAGNISFAAIKVSEGATISDSRAQENARSCDVLGIPWMAYHFAYPQRIFGDVESELSYFKECLKRLPEPTMGVALDLESNPDKLDQEEYTSWASKFMEGVGQLFGDEVYVYGGPYFLNKTLLGGHDLGKYRLWLAEYIDCAEPPQLPWGWGNWKVWQYGVDTIPGISGKVDMDRMR